MDEKNEQNVYPQESFPIETNSLQSADYFLSTFSDDYSISMEQLKQYIKYPMIYNRILRAISRQAYNMHGIYANAIDYSIAIPSLILYLFVEIKLNKTKKEK